LIKNSHPFGKKCQTTAGGIFLTHTVHTVGVRDGCWGRASALPKFRQFSWGRGSDKNLGRRGI